MGFLKWIVGLPKRVLDKLEDLIEEISDDPLVERGLEADLGLPLGTFDKAELAKKKGERQVAVNGIEDYINDVDATAEKVKVTVDFIQTYMKLWSSVFDAAKTEDTSLVVDELVYRLFQTTSVDLIKYDYPTAYAWMRYLGAISIDLRVTVEESLAPQVPANIFSGEYWSNIWPEFKRGYHRFRLDQAEDIELEEPEGPIPDAERIRRAQLGLMPFGLSDVVLGGQFALVSWFQKNLESLGPKIDHYYGWELPPRALPPPCGEPSDVAEVPLADHIASRAYTLRVSGPAGAAKDASATLTQLFLVDEEDRLGWLFSLRGAVVFEEKAGSKERPLKIKIKVDAREGLDAVLKFEGDDKFVFTGAPDAGMQLSIEPAQPSTVAPAISLPEAKGTRLEIGDFSFKVDLSKEGFKIRAEARKSAFVIVADEADSFVSEAIPAKETRVEFDLALVATEDGVYAEGGGRFGTTIPLNWSWRGLTVKSVQLALTPSGTETGSELLFTAATSLHFKLGPLQVVIEQIGTTLGIGSSSDAAPDDALELLPFLYLRDPGFKAPSGVGIVVDSACVTGGGFLFFDQEKGEYAGVLQLQIGNRLAVKAIGLITTKQPDGSKGFSLLVIVSVEWNPPLQLWLGFTLGGVGGLLGIHRTLDAEALRAGLRTRALDAVLFPEDPVANAGRLINALRSIFPPARERHLFGLSVRLGWGTPALFTLDVAVIYEFGDNPRLAILGQLHLALPRKAPVLEMHIDGVGIWDLDRGDFSLDARIYDSRIGFVTFHGDVAVRHSSSGGDAGFLLSAGGYHPEFAAPASFPKLERLKISAANTENLRLLLTGYVAFTSNTKQFGAEIDFFVGIGGFSIECRIGFDGLWADDRFVIDFDVEAKIKYKGMTLLGVDVYGRYTGPEPKRVQGEWSVDLWLFSISKSFDKTFGPDRPPAEVPAADPLAALEAALRDPLAWNAQLPPQARTLVTLRSEVGGADVLAHPLGELSVRQQVLPLGIQIDRFGGGTPPGERRFDITKVTLGGQPVEGAKPLTELFAAASFLELSDDEKIARPSFEPMPAGLSLQLQGLTFGGQTAATTSHAAVSEIDFDDKIYGAGGGVVKGDRGVLGGILAEAAADFGPAALCALRTGGPARFRLEGPQFRVREEGFVVAGMDDLAPTLLDGAGETPTSFTAVAQLLERHLQENPQARGSLQVVPAFKAEELVT